MNSSPPSIHHAIGLDDMTAMQVAYWMTSVGVAPTISKALEGVDGATIKEYCIDGEFDLKAELGINTMQLAAFHKHVRKVDDEGWVEPDMYSTPNNQVRKPAGGKRPRGTPPDIHVAYTAVENAMAKHNQEHGTVEMMGEPYEVGGNVYVTCPLDNSQIKLTQPNIQDSIVKHMKQTGKHRRKFEETYGTCPYPLAQPKIAPMSKEDLVKHESELLTDAIAEEEEKGTYGFDAGEWRVVIRDKRAGAEHTTGCETVVRWPRRGGNFTANVHAHVKACGGERKKQKRASSRCFLMLKEHPQ